MSQDNSLNDVSYCIRKGIGVHALKPLRDGVGKTQGDVGKYLGVNQGLISKWEQQPRNDDEKVTSTTPNREAPRLEHIFRLCDYYNVSFAHMLWYAIEAERREQCLCDSEMLNKIETIAGSRNMHAIAETVDIKGSDHFELIKKLQRSVYVGFFLSDDDLGVELPPRMEHFIVETSAPLKSGAVPAFMHVVGKAENGYRCNIVSPPNQRHLYIYMRQDSARNDRALLFFYGDSDIQGMYVCGSGAILSTDRKYDVKRLQWVVIVRIGDNNVELTRDCSDERQMPGIQYELSRPSLSDYTNEVDQLFISSDVVLRCDNIVRPHLMHPLPNPRGWKLDFDCLKARQDEFYNRVYSDKAIAIELGDRWRNLHEKH